MLRAIFLPELQRSLIQRLAIVIPVLIGLLLLDWLTAGAQDTVRRTFSGTPDTVIDTLLWLLIVLSAFVAGIGAFARINERHIPFVHSLPMPRLELWAAIAGAHFITTALMVPLLIILRPSLWRQLTGGVLSGTLVFGIASYVVLFAAGCCFVMLFRNLAVSVTLGGLIAGVSLGVTALFASTLDLNSRVYGIPFSRNGPDESFFVLGCLVLAVLYLGLSLRFFIKGEFNLPKTKIRNWALVGAVLAVYPLMLSPMIRAGVLRNDGATYKTFSVSSDGKYLAVLENPLQRPLESRITIVDAESGSKTGAYSGYGLLDVSWSKSVPVLNVHVMQSPLQRLGFYLPPSDSIVRLSPEGKKLGQVGFGFGEIVGVHGDRRGRLLVSALSHGQAKLVAVDDEGLTTELVSTPAKDGMTLDLWSSPPTPLFLIHSNRNGLERGWSIEDGARETPYSQNDKGQAQGRFLFDDGWYSEPAAVKELARRFPIDGELQARGAASVTASYALPRVLQGNLVVIPNDWAFAIITNKVSGKRELLGFSKHRGNWRIVRELPPLLPEFRIPENWPPLVFGYAVAGENMAAYVVRDPHREYLYDARLDRTIELTGEGQREEFCGAGQRWPSGLVIPCTHSVFVYTSGQELRRIPVEDFPITNPYYMGGDGSLVYRARSNFNTLRRRRPDGAVIQLWPVR